MRARRYWWVNHKQTHAHELNGGYLWSPKTEKNGVRSQFYENMLEAHPGDLVLSYASTAVRAIGRVAEPAFSQSRPSDFGSIGEQWETAGWLLPLSWQPVEPVFPKQFLDQIRLLLPARYSPLQPETGAGNQKAYLAEISEALFEFIASKASPQKDATELPALDRDVHLSSLLDRIEADLARDTGLDATTRRQVIEARRGQGIFRQNVAKFERCCRVTGVSNPGLLVASHIKPWRACWSAEERLDGHNGFLFAPHVDRLFDRGLISIGVDGQILVSRRLDLNDLAKLGLEHIARAKIGPMTDRQAKYIAYHRENEFERVGKNGRAE